MTGRAPTMSATKPQRRLFLTDGSRALLESGDDVVEVELFVSGDGSVKVRRASSGDGGVDQAGDDPLAVRFMRSTIDQA